MKKKEIRTFIHPDVWPQVQGIAAEGIPCSSHEHGEHRKDLWAHWFVDALQISGSFLSFRFATLSKQELIFILMTWKLIL